MLRFVQSSVAVQVTILVPSGKTLPDGGEQATVGVASRLSVAVGVLKFSTVPVGLHVQTKRLLGQVMTGGVVSRVTRTRNVQAVWFVQLSVAVQVTVVLPNGNTLPDTGEQATATLKSALSVAVGVG